MIWATVSSWSCFCWLYSASPSLAVNFGIDRLVMSMYRVFSCVVGQECFLWPVHSLGKTLLAFALLHSVLQRQICLLLQVFLDFLLLHSSPLYWKGHLICLLILKGLVGIHRTVQLQLLWCYWLEHRLGLLWYWMVCLGSEQRSFCRFWDYIQILHFGLFFWYDGFSSSSKGFLPTVGDVMVIWVIYIVYLFYFYDTNFLKCF